MTDEFLWELTHDKIEKITDNIEFLQTRTELFKNLEEHFHTEDEED